MSVNAHSEGNAKMTRAVIVSALAMSRTAHLLSYTRRVNVTFFFFNFSEIILGRIALTV